MKLAASNTVVKTSGDFETAGYEIEVSAHAFAVLSKGLYSDPHRAIVRELACNAWDSHIAAGTTDKPFEVCLPNPLAPMFKIRDYGTGLSDAQIAGPDGIYRKYFKSTKQESDTMTGCFGLGSKSPFAYTKKFTIVSFFNGKRYHYINIVNAKGFPDIIKMAEEDTEEPNGVEVSFNVEQADFMQFERAAQKALRPFKLRPIVKGVDPKRIFGQDVPPGKQFLEGNGWKMNVVLEDSRPQYYYGGGSHGGDGVPTAVMGNVEYPIRTDEVRKGISQNAALLLRSGSGLVIDFPIGAFEITPSRESIQWTEFSTNNINDRLEAIYDEIIKLVNEKISSAPTFWKAVMAAQKYVANGPLAYLHLTATWGGRKIDANYHMPIPDGFEICNAQADYPRTNRLGVPQSKNGSSIWPLNNIQPHETKFYFADFKGAKARLSDTIREDWMRNEQALLITPGKWVDVPKSEKGYYPGKREWTPSYDLTQKAVIAEKLGIKEDEIILCSAIPQKPRAKKETRSRLAGSNAHAYAFRLQGYGQAADQYWDEEADFDLDAIKDGIYVEINKWYFANSMVAKHPKEFKEFLSNFKVLGLKFPDTGFIGVKTADLKKFKKHKNWKTIDEFVTAKLTDYWTNNTDVQKARAVWMTGSSTTEQEAHAQYLRDVQYLFEHNKAKFTKDFLTIGNDLSDVVKLAPKVASFERCMVGFKNTPLHKEMIKDNTKAKELIANLTSHYPLFNTLFSRKYNAHQPFYLRERATDAVVNYINLVDNS